MTNPERPTYGAPQLPPPAAVTPPAAPPFPTAPSSAAPPQGDYPQAGFQAPPAVYKSRIAAGLLGVFLGTFGVHNFYLGKNGLAVAQLLITVLSFGALAIVSWVWGLVEGILILSKAPNYRTDGRGGQLHDYMTEG